MDREGILRDWFGAVRAAAEAGAKELPEELCLSPLQERKLQILLRQDLTDLLFLCMRRLEDLSSDASDSIFDQMYSELMEDAVAGIWNESENLELLRFLKACSEGIGAPDDFCDYFRRILADGNAHYPAEPDELALRVKEKADKHLNAFLEERKQRRHAASYRRDDEPPPWLDEFEYIDWVMTH